MADYQQIIDDIRDLLLADEQVLSDRLRQLAGDYTAACLEVNKRLRRCGEHLKLQLWCEAVQLAEMEPKLLDALGALDFAEKEEFAELTRKYELGQAPQLLFDIANDLQDAYSRYATIERPLANLRILNLKHASAARRIGVMRELQKREPGVPFWIDDIRRFEQQTFDEIAQQARIDAKRMDVAALNSRLAELTTGDWTERPPAKLVKGIETLRKSIEGKTATSRLPTVTDELVTYFDHHASHFQENSPPALVNDPSWLKTVGLYETWYAAAEQAGLIDSDPLYQKAAPALAEIHWIQSEQKRDKSRREALAELEDGIVSVRVKRSQLRGLHRTAAQWALIPTDVEEKYQGRLKQLWWGENWERVVGGALFLMLVGAAIVFFLVVRSRS